MSDEEQIPEVTSYAGGPWPFSESDIITVRVGSRLYTFEKDSETGECVYLHNSPFELDDNEPEPFDPAGYR